MIGFRTDCAARQREERNLYIVTVKYSKERFAEFEIGDSIFPYDNRVEVIQTGIPGVLLVKTVLNFEKLLKALLEYPPSTVARVVPVTACVDYEPRPEDLAEAIYGVVKRLTERVGRVRLGRHGRLSSSKWRAVMDMLSLKLRIRRGGGQLTLLIEPLTDKVCVGVVPDDNDKLFLKTVMKLQPHRKAP